jgi:hypothetical protein
MQGAPDVAAMRPSVIRIMRRKHGLAMVGEAVDFLLQVLQVSAIPASELTQTLDFIAQAFINHEGAWPTGGARLARDAGGGCCTCWCFLIDPGTPGY